MTQNNRDAFEAWFSDKNWNKYECFATWQARQPEITRLKEVLEVMAVALETITNPPDRRYVSDENIANGMIGIAQDALAQYAKMKEDK